MSSALIVLVLVLVCAMLLRMPIGFSRRPLAFGADRGEQCVVELGGLLQVVGAEGCVSDHAGLLMWREPGSLAAVGRCGGPGLIDAHADAGDTGLCPALVRTQQVSQVDFHFNNWSKNP